MIFPVIFLGFPLEIEQVSVKFMQISVKITLGSVIFYLLSVKNRQNRKKIPPSNQKQAWI